MTRFRSILTCATLAAIVLASLGLHGFTQQEVTPPPASPLAPFEKLIGGKWEMEGSYQEFEWGVGRRTVLSRSFFVTEGRSKKVSEGFWYWHPGEREIRGLFVAIDMPVELFEYTSRFEDSKMVSDLRSYASNGDEELYTEIFEFTGEGSYEWSLFDGGSEGQTRVMGGTFVRK